MNFIKRFRVIQLYLNSHKVCKILIIFVIFLIIYNNMIVLQCSTLGRTRAQMDAPLETTYLYNEL